MAREDQHDIRAVVIASSPIHRVGIVTALNRRDGIRVVDGNDVASVDLQSTNVVVLVHARGDEVPVERAVDQFRERYDGRLVVMAEAVTDAQLLSVFESDGHAIVLLKSEVDRLAVAVRAVAEGRMFVDPYLVERLVRIAMMGMPGEGRPYDLTVQQQRVLALVPDGLTNKEIGEALGISPNTVKAHLHKAMEKLDVNDRHEAAVFVQREGLA